MRVTKPSTWGCTVAERRDFTTPTNSVVCSTGRSASVTTSTGMAGGPPRAVACLLHAAATTARATRGASLRRSDDGPGERRIAES